MWQDESEAVADAAHTPILMYDATRPLSAQQLSDGGDVNRRMKRHHDHQVRRTVPGAQTSFLGQDLNESRTK